MRYLLDTGILIGFERKNSGIINRVREIIRDLDVPFITLFNYGEFYRGYVQKQPDAIAEAEHFLDSFQQLPFTKTSVKIYAELSYRYSKKGIKIEPFDLLIAAAAIENDLIILTTDTDFDKISEIRNIVFTS